MLVAICILVLLAAIAFVVSSGPVIAIAFNIKSFGVGQVESVVGVYRPLYRACPQQMGTYLNCFGFSDVEIFFVFQERQREVTVKKNDELFKNHR